jgi:serine/threonine protein kinase
MVWQAGTQLKGGYIIEKQIGDGGFGLTYLGYKSDHLTKVAIKTLKDEYASIEDWQDEFRREAMSLSKCNHPQIVKIYDINLHESGWLGHRKQWFMVMEYIKGKTILEKMQTWEQQGYNPRFSEDDALRYIRQIAKALVFTHDRHPPILHRDLKPQNIMLRGDRDEAVLIDFGLAREFADAPVNTTKVMVSNGFAPIEQYSFNSIRQAATDVYGLAATLYYMVTNQLPTNANNRAQGNLLPSPQEYASVSDATCDAILKGLAFLASDRPQTMQEWLDLLPSPEYVEIVEHEDVDKDAIPDASVIENVICESTQKVSPSKLIDANAYFYRALEKQYNGDPQGALRDYDEAIRLLNTSFLKHFYGNEFLKKFLGDREKTIIEAYYRRGILKYYLGDREGQKFDFEYIDKISPNYFYEREMNLVKNCRMVSNMCETAQELKSKSEINEIIEDECKNLENLLQQKRWQEANSQTIGLLLLIGKIKSTLSYDSSYYKYYAMCNPYTDQAYTDLDRCLPDSDLKNIAERPEDREVFQLIDRLWMDYSNSTLGFSIQKSILNVDMMDFSDNCLYGKQLGWFFGKEDWDSRKDWVNYETLNWLTPEVTLGHLPYLGHSFLWTSPCKHSSDHDLIYRIPMNNIKNMRCIDTHYGNLIGGSLCDVLRLFSLLL